MNNNITWLFGSSQNAKVIAEDPQASNDLNGSSPFVEYSPTWSPPASWDANSFAYFTSITTLSPGLETDKDCKYVMYDDENWQFTPVGEQHNPAECIKIAAGMVHQAGMKFISAPGIDIATSVDPNAESMFNEYLKLDIPGDAARYADVFVIQAQRLETNVVDYTKFVEQAVHEAQEANPDIKILAGLTTQVNGVTITPSKILEDIDATRAYVSGYWFNIPTPGSAYAPSCTAFTPQIAISVLHALG